MEHNRANTPRTPVSGIRVVFFAAGIVLAGLLSASAIAKDSNMHNLTAKGSFSVQMTPQKELDETRGVSIKRLSLDKTYEGELSATGQGEMLTATTPVQGSAGYVAIEKISGTLDGKSGSFVVQHTGIMGIGAPALDVTIVPDTGTGELTGISGKLKIDNQNGQHTYVLQYALPQE